jgi:hypothetical protein
MANVIRSQWFGRSIKILLSNDKTITGELAEVTDNYLVIDRSGVPTQVMLHAIIAVWPAGEKGAAEGTS